MNFMICWSDEERNDWEIVTDEDKKQNFVNNLVEEMGLDLEEDITIFNLSDEIAK